MKTIAITIDEDMLADLDRVAGLSGASGSNRSRVVRLAVREYLSRARQQADEAKEREILRRHRGRLQREAAALLKDQAKP